MPRAVLASLTGLGADHAIMEAAIAAARMEGGHVTALHARIDAVETAAMIEVTFPQHQHGLDVLHRITREEAERAQHARAAFDAAIGRHALVLNDDPGTEAVSVSWRQTRSFFSETMEEARYHDLVVMGHEPALPLERVKMVLMQSGRPLLLAPARPVPVMGRSIAIAWKASAEAARAVTAAGPLLARAGRVSILTASHNQAGDDRDRYSAEHLARQLRWRGVKAEVQVDYTAGREAATLQEMAYGKDADLLVMGAYGHSRLREFVLGGVTESMLLGCAIPVMMFR